MAPTLGLGETQFCDISGWAGPILGFAVTLFRSLPVHFLSIVGAFSVNYGQLRWNVGLFWVKCWSLLLKCRSILVTLELGRTHFVVPALGRSHFWGWLGPICGTGGWKGPTSGLYMARFGLLTVEKDPLWGWDKPRLVKHLVNQLDIIH